MDWAAALPDDPCHVANTTRPEILLTGGIAVNFAVSLTVFLLGFLLFVLKHRFCFPMVSDEEVFLEETAAPEFHNALRAGVTIDMETDGAEDKDNEEDPLDISDSEHESDEDRPATPLPQHMHQQPILQPTIIPTRSEAMGRAMTLVGESGVIGGSPMTLQDAALRRFARRKLKDGRSASLSALASPLLRHTASFSIRQEVEQSRTRLHRGSILVHALEDDSGPSGVIEADLGNSAKLTARDSTYLQSITVTPKRKKRLSHRESTFDDAEETAAFARWKPSWFQWLGDGFRATDEDIEEAGGKDALDYFRFQRFLLVMVGILLVPSMTIALPLNIHGGAGFTDFSSTTVINILPSSSFVWGHTALLIFNSFAVMIALHYFARNSITYRLPERKQSLMVRGIKEGRIQDVEGKIRGFLKTAYPQGTVLGLHVVPDLRRVVAVAKDLRVTKKRHLRYRYFESQGEPKFKREYGCCGEKRDALEYTIVEARINKQRLETAWERGVVKHSHTAFITFEASLQAKEFFRLFENQLLIPSKLAEDWSMKSAPPPGDLVWEAISVPRPEHFFRKVILNLLLIVLLLIWTTPISILTSVETALDLQLDQVIVSVLLPPILLFILSRLLLFLILKTSILELHSTKSARDLSVVYKSIIYTLCSSFLLPALMLTSAEELFNLVTTKAFVKHLGCVFSPANGALFLNYCVTMTFIGEAFRMAPLISGIEWLYKILKAQTPQELHDARQDRVAQVSLGQKYASLLTMFIIGLVFNSACPLVLPVILLRLSVGYFFDKVFILNTSRRPDCLPDGRLLNAVIAAIFACLLIYQILYAFFLGFRINLTDPQFILTMLCIFGTFVVIMLRETHKINYARPTVLNGPTVQSGTPLSEVYLAPLYRKRLEKVKRNLVDRA